MTKDVERGTDELADTILSEKKPSTKNVERGTDELTYTLQSENKSLTKNVETGTDEFSDTLCMRRNIQFFMLTKVLMNCNL